MIASAEVQPGDAERDARTYSCFAQGLICTPGRLPGLKLQSQTIVESIALGLLNVHQYIFLTLVASRILNSRIHLAEDTEVVQALLGIQHINLAQRITGLDLDFTLHDGVAGVVQAGHVHLIHYGLIAFVDGISHIHDAV